MNSSNLIGIFLTGLLTGGLTCMAVQGGLLAATIAQREEERLKQKAQNGNALPIIAFLIAKLIAYTLLGAILGLIGSAFKLSLTTQILLQFAVIIFMFGTALNILDVHPIFRYFVIQPPRFLTRIIRKQSKSKQLFAPAILGAFTVLIPCGTTQAMMALAIAAGKPLYGAAILFSFILGTSPVFFILGYFATKLGDVLQEKFMKYAALAIILLALFNLNNTIALTGSNWTAQTIAQNIFCALSYCDTALPSDQLANNPIDNANINITAQGYNPNNLTVKTGSKVTLHLKNSDGQGCTQAFTIPSLGIQKVVPIGQSGTISFTAPDKPGTLRFMCSMGMYGGTIKVVKT